MANKILHPEVLWAQTDSLIYITIALSDSKDVNVQFLDKAIKFSAIAHDEQYAFELPLHKEYDQENSRSDVTAQRIFLVVKKKQEELGFWPRLHDGKKPNYLKVDFSRWRDEDDDEPEPDYPGFSTMGEGGGLGDLITGDTSDEEFYSDEEEKEQAEDEHEASTSEVKAPVEEA